VRRGVPALTLHGLEVEVAVDEHRRRAGAAEPLRGDDRQRPVELQHPAVVKTERREVVADPGGEAPHVIEVIGITRDGGDSEVLGEAGDGLLEARVGQGGDGVGGGVQHGGSWSGEAS
jgi:hypothetical protein